MEITTATPSYSTASRMTSVAALTSYGSTVLTNFAPTPRAMDSMSSGSVTTPPNSLPVPGLGWCPVIAVVRLSRITMTILWLLNKALIRGFTPEWKNVESPMNAIGSWSVVWANPPAAPAPPPMHMMKSASLKGGDPPNV